MACMKSDGDCGGGAGPAYEPLDPAGAEESISDSDSGQDDVLRHLLAIPCYGCGQLSPQPSSSQPTPFPGHPPHPSHPAHPNPLTTSSCTSAPASPSLITTTPAVPGPTPSPTLPRCPSPWVSSPAQSRLPVPLLLHSYSSPGLPKQGCGVCEVCLDPGLLHLPCLREDLLAGVTQAQCSDPHVRLQAAAAGRKRAYAGEPHSHASHNTLHQLVAGQGSLPLVHPPLLQPPSDCQAQTELFGSRTDLSDNLTAGVDHSHRCEPADTKTPLASDAPAPSSAPVPAPSSAPPLSHQPHRSPSHGHPGTQLPPSCHGAHPAPSPPPAQLVGVEWIRQQHLLRQQQPLPTHLSTLGTAPTGLAAARVMAAAMAQPNKVAGPGTPAGYAPVVVDHAARFQPDSLAAELDPHGSLLAHSGDKVQELATRVSAAAVSGEPYLAFTEPRPALCEWCQAPDHTVGSCPVWLLLAPSATSPPPTSPVPGAERSQQSDPAANTAGHMAKKMKVAGTSAASARTDNASAAVAAVGAASLVVPDLAWD